MIRTSFLALDYQASRRFSLSALLPVRLVTAPKDIHPGERVTRSFKGLGDLIALGNWQVRLPDSPGRLTASLQFGLRFPTGRSQPDHTFAGSLSRDPVLQTGHGTFDPLFGASCFKTVGKTTLSADVLARLSGGENRYGIRFGNEVQGGLALTREVRVPHFLSAALSGAQLGIRLHGVKSGHDYDQGKIIGNTGGQWLFVLPSLSFQTRGGVSYFLQFQLPAYQNVNGAQLVAPYGITTGFAFSPLRRKASREAVTTASPAETNSAPADEPEVISRGGRVELSAHLAAGRVTVFEFYADWCGVCRKIDAGLRQMMRTRTDATLKKINIGDGETEVAKQYNIEITPTFHVYSASGRLVKVFSGDDLGELEKAIREATAVQEK